MGISLSGRPLPHPSCPHQARPPTTDTARQVVARRPPRGVQSEPLFPDRLLYARAVPMTPGGPVTRLLQGLLAGDTAAIQPLREGYFRRLVGLASARLRGTARQVADEEDVALSAFDSFCRRAERGCFPQLADRDGLWRLLVVVTARKAARLAHHHSRQKRGGG